MRGPTQSLPVAHASKEVEAVFLEANLQVFRSAALQR